MTNEGRPSVIAADVDWGKLPDGHLVVDFAGEYVQLARDQQLVLGRQADLCIDDNPYLHRRFLQLERVEDMWWVRNIGAHLSAHITDERGLIRSSLAPGARLPLVFPVTLLTFSAGTTGYELVLTVAAPAYEPQATMGPPDRYATIAPTQFTPTQLLAVLVLAEPLLRRAGSGASVVPSAVDAARRLGWTQTRFNRKLDNVCEKLERSGVAGLRGGPRGAAANRRVLLVEYAVSTLLVTAEDLPLLDEECRRNARVAAPARRGHEAQADAAAERVVRRGPQHPDRR